MDKNILLIGGGGHCESVLDALLEIGEYKKTGIVVNKEQKKLFNKFPVVGTDDDLPLLKNTGYNYAFITVGSIGDVTIRKKLYNMAISMGFKIPNIIAPSAVVSKHCKLGKGIFVGKNAVINAGAEIGNGVILNTSSVVEHNCIINDFVHVSPSATVCGNVSIGYGVHVGAGAIIMQGLNIGKRSVVGMGSIVIRNVPDDVKIVGNPGRNITASGGEEI